MLTLSVLESQLGLDSKTREDVEDVVETAKVEPIDEEEQITQEVSGFLAVCHLSRVTGEADLHFISS